MPSPPALDFIIFPFSFQLYDCQAFCIITELGQSLSDFGKAVKLLGECEGNALGKAFFELGAKSEVLSIHLQKEVLFELLVVLKMK